MLNKNHWILSLGLAALILAPVLGAAESAKAKAPAKAEAKETTEAAPTGHKSPGLAVFLAVVPGIAIHGTGHMYAGSWMKGVGLLAIEGVAIGVASNAVSSGTSDIAALGNGLSNGKFPTDVSGAYTKSGILIVSTMAFLWTWWDDMAGSPIAVNEYNKLVDEKSQAHLRLQPRLDGVELALSTEF